LEELHECMVGVEEERVTEAEKLAAPVGETSNALMDLVLPPIREIPQVPWKAWEVLKAVGIILKRLQEEHSSDAGPWDFTLTDCHAHGPRPSCLSFFVIYILYIYTHTNAIHHVG
jgi:hypothetical protein